jgi:predicted DNA-binding transcriptional regulator AlpA
MTTQEKLIRRKQSLLELAEYLQKVSQACKIHGVSRQHFYDMAEQKIPMFKKMVHGTGDKVLYKLSFE